MFFWLIAIPFFVIIAMFTLFRLPSSDLNQPEEMQDAAMAFRMAMQHDAAAKLMQEYQGSSESDMFDEGSYDLGGDTWKETILESGYLPSSFIPDTDNITTYVRCVNGLRQIASCRGANGIYMITAATPPSGESITARWFEQKGAQNLASQLNKYEGSFPVKQGGLVLPRKPRKEEDESDEDFAIRLNAYKETKAQYKLLKRNYYDFGNKLPRPNTVVGEVRAYPFNSESAESRVILTRMKVIEGEVHFDSELMPTDLPAGGEGSDSLDFNGEAVVFSKSSSCDEAPCACTKGTDCGTGAYCQGEICVASCSGFGADENRTCYTSCFSDSQCPEGYFCDSGLCETTPAGTVVYEVTEISNNNLTSNLSSVGSYTIPTSGYYQIRLYGGHGLNYNFTVHSDGSQSGGGIIVADKYFPQGTFLDFKGIKGGIRTPQNDWMGGVGLALFEGVGGTYSLVAGGGNSGQAGGGGLVGGWGMYDNSSRIYRGYGMTDTTSPTGNNSKYCTSVNCSYGAFGGRMQYNSTNFGYGGSGSTASDCASFGFEKCAIIPGGNSRTYGTSGYSSTNYGNWYGNTLTGGQGYIAIVYCGNTLASCPASCGNIACTTGTCNYHTGLCE